MATRKRQKSLADIRRQVARIKLLATSPYARERERNQGRLERARNIAREYNNNITGSSTFQRDLQRVNKANAARHEAFMDDNEEKYWDEDEKAYRYYDKMDNRKYVNYNTNAAKAASNG